MILFKVHIWFETYDAFWTFFCFELWRLIIYNKLIINIYDDFYYRTTMEKHKTASNGTYEYDSDQFIFIYSGKCKFSWIQNHLREKQCSNYLNYDIFTFRHDCNSIFIFPVKNSVIFCYLHESIKDFAQS